MNGPGFLPLCAAVALASCGSPTDKPPAAGNSASPTGSPIFDGAKTSSEVSYPGARLNENLFTSADPPDDVLSWYWNPDRPMFDRNGKLWTVSKPERRGDGYLVRMTIVGDDDAQTYAVYLDPGAGGGTAGRIRPISDEEIKSGVTL